MYTSDVKNLQIVRYRRKSTEGEDRQIASLADQDIELDGLNTNLGISPSQIVDNIAESKSAKKPGRLEFNNRVLKPIDQGKANAIEAWQPNRLSRNAIDTAALINLMDEGKLRALITKQQIYWNTPNDKFLLALACGQAKLENDNKGVDVRRGLAGKIRKGWRPGVPPIGY